MVHARQQGVCCRCKGSAYEVEMVTLDDQNITDCSLIKIDVQGFEWQVIQGAQNLIETQLPCVTVEPNKDITQMVEFFFNRDYKFVEVKITSMYDDYMRLRRQRVRFMFAV